MTRQEALQRARAAKMAKQPPLHERFWSKVDRRGADDCWPWIAAPRKPSEGYGAFWLNGRHQAASRVALFLATGVEPGAQEVCHRCDNPPCCNPTHLFLGSRQDNNADKVQKGRHAFGERNGFSKLTDEDALEIKRLRPNGRAPRGYRKTLAARFNVSPATITDVWSRRWNHVR